MDKRKKEQIYIKCKIRLNGKRNDENNKSINYIVIVNI